jgi:hypothetical protein
MGLIELLVTIVVIGVLLWLVNTYIPMDGKIKQIQNITVVVLLVLFLLSLFLPLGQLSSIRVGK